MILIDPLEAKYGDNLFHTTPPAVTLYNPPDPARRKKAQDTLYEILEWVPPQWAMSIKIQLDHGGWGDDGIAYRTGAYKYLGIKQPQWVWYQQSALRVMRIIAPVYKQERQRGREASVAAVCARCRYPDLLRAYVRSGRIQEAAKTLGIAHSTAQGRLNSMKTEPMVAALRSARTYRRRQGCSVRGTP